MSDTEWTEEKRKEREAMRAGARLAMREYGKPWMSDATVELVVDRACPAPPPLHTYGREVIDPIVGWTYRRRSDGAWLNREGGVSRRTDASVREFAAEVPLTDAECDSLTLGNWGGPEERRAFIRAAFARVLRGEVRGE